MSVAVASDPLMLGGLLEHRTRELPDGSLIEFEFAPAGFLMLDGERRQRDHRAYYFTPAESDCAPCEGNGRVPGKRSGTTKLCPTCKGTGEGAKRVRLTSVSTVCDTIIPKPGIPRWSEARGIEGAIEAVRRGLIDPYDEASAAMSVEIVRASRLGADRVLKDAAARGLDVHGCLEHYMRTGSPPDPADSPVEHHGYLRGLAKWLLHTNPEPDGAQIEELVAHPEDGYAGRLDLRARCNGPLIGYDAKTTEHGQIYRGVHVQLGLYERAAVRCGDEPVDKLRVVSFDSHGGYHEMDADARPEMINAALAYYRESKATDAICDAHNRAGYLARTAAC
jgi:hypothetical protein